jgi:hypothetical protein
MAAPPLRIPFSLSMDDFEKSVGKARSVTQEATQFMVKQFVKANLDIAAVFAKPIAMGTFEAVRTVGIPAFKGLSDVVTPLALRFAPLVGAVTAVVGVFKLMGYATELAREKIEEFNETAKKAGDVNFSTDMFQRLNVSGQALKLTIEEVEAALAKFNTQATERLGGGFLQGRLNELREAGNFSGNAGVGQFGAAVGNEAKLRAAVDLISEALDKGERLAALDLAEKAFGSKVAENLRANSNFLREMVENADRLAATKIVSDEDLGIAISLKTRLEEAQKILSERMKPIQADLARLGMNYEESWVSIYENLAGAVQQANRLYDWLKEIPDIFARAGNAPFWNRLREWSERQGMNSTPAQLGLIEENGVSGSDSPAIRALRARMNNPLAIRQAMREATETDFAVRRDTSRAPQKNEATAQLQQQMDAVERLINSMQRSNDILQVEMDTLGKSASERERGIAMAKAEAAARSANRTLTEEERQGILRLADAHAALQERLEAARPLANFLRDAEQVNRALSEASVGGLRSFENGIIGVVNGTRTLKQAFADMARSIGEDLLRISIRQAITGPLSRGLLGAFGGGGNGTGFDINPWSAGGMFGVGSNAEGTDYWRGGPTWVGEKGPELLNLPRGSQIVPNDIARNMGGGGVSAPVRISIDARGADSAGLAKLQTQLAKLETSLPQRVVMAVRDARAANVKI